MPGVAVPRDYRACGRLDGNGVRRVAEVELRKVLARAQARHDLRLLLARDAEVLRVRRLTHLPVAPGHNAQCPVRAVVVGQQDRGVAHERRTDGMHGLVRVEQHRHAAGWFERRGHARDDRVGDQVAHERQDRRAQHRLLKHRVLAEQIEELTPRRAGVAAVGTLRSDAQHLLAQPIDERFGAGPRGRHHRVPERVELRRVGVQRGGCARLRSGGAHGFSSLPGRS